MASDGILDYAAADALEFCVEAAHYHNADTIYAVKVRGHINSLPSNTPANTPSNTPSVPSSESPYITFTGPPTHPTTHPSTHHLFLDQAFAMHALANILDTAGGRTEFLGVSKVVARDGEDRGMAVRKHLVKRLTPHPLALPCPNSRPNAV